MGPQIRLSAGSLEAILHPDHGGRLAALRAGDTDLILPPDRVEGFYGDTFWPSPQERFDWPPPAILDNEPYQVLHYDETSATLLSAPDPDFGFQIEKHFQLSPTQLSFRFRLTNIWDQPQQVAPWQVTRAPSEGILIWASGKPFTDEDRLIKQREDPGCYYLHEKDEKPFPTPIPQQKGLCQLAVDDVPITCKLFTDAQGWLAHLQGKLLVIRSFPDITPDQAAPRQGELELYFNPERGYIELENQGPYQTLRPGETLAYETNWRFHALEGNSISEALEHIPSHLP